MWILTAMKSLSFTVFSYNATVLLIQPNPTHGWTQPMSISALLHRLPPPIGERSIVMSVCVGVSVSVCVFVCQWSYLRSYTSDLHQFFVHVIYGRGKSVFASDDTKISPTTRNVWRSSDVLRINGFVDDVIFAHKLIGCSTSPPGWGSEACRIVIPVAGRQAGR